MSKLREHYHSNSNLNQDAICITTINVAMGQAMDYDSPREFDNLGTLSFFTQKYWSSDKKADINLKQFSGREELAEYLDAHGYIWLWVYGYVHGTVKMVSTEYVYPYTCRWDGGTAGIIYATKETVREWFMRKRVTKTLRGRAIKSLEAEIREYNDYLNGEGDYADPEPEEEEEESDVQDSL